MGSSPQRIFGLLISVCAYSSDNFERNLVVDTNDRRLANAILQGNYLFYGPDLGHVDTYLRR